jgi:hypothetical protein
MNQTAQTTMSNTIFSTNADDTSELCNFSRGFNYCPKLAGYSRNASEYLDTRVAAECAENLQHAGYIAIGRLDWLLKQARHELSGQLTKRNYFTLLDIFQNEIFSVWDIKAMESVLCEAWGLDLSYSYDLNDLPPIVRKLTLLSPAAKLALADALELAWQGMRQGVDLSEVLRKLNIEFSAAPVDTAE